MNKKQTPSHPGGILKRLYLQPPGVSIIDLAKALGVSRKSVSKLDSEREA